jgi:hypothetical protein
VKLPFGRRPEHIWIQILHMGAEPASSRTHPGPGQCCSCGRMDHLDSCYHMFEEISEWIENSNEVSISFTSLGEKLFRVINLAQSDNYGGVRRGWDFRNICQLIFAISENCLRERIFQHETKDANEIKLDIQRNWINYVRRKWYIHLAVPGNCLFSPGFKLGRILLDCQNMLKVARTMRM